MTTSIARAKFEENPEIIGNWMKYVFSSYGDRAMQGLGFITGFRVKEIPKELSPLTKMVLEKLAQVKGGAFWFEALFDARTTSVAWDNAQLLATSMMTPKNYLEELQRAIDEQKGPISLVQKGWISPPPRRKSNPWKKSCKIGGTHSFLLLLL